MAQASSTNSPRRPYDFKLPSSDGIFPTDTMRLHQRLFSWRRKRHIPVHEIQESRKAEQLSGYMIDPKYMPKKPVVKSSRSKVDVAPTLQKAPIYRYSQLSLDARRSDSALASKIRRAVKHWWSVLAAGLLSVGVAAKGTAAKAWQSIPLTSRQGTAVAYSTSRGAKTLKSRTSTRVGLMGALAVVAALLVAGAITQPFINGSGNTPVTSSTSEKRRGEDSAVDKSKSDSTNANDKKTDTTSQTASPLNAEGNSSSSVPGTSNSSTPSGSLGGTLPVGGLGGGASSSPTPTPTTSASPQPTPTPTPSPGSGSGGCLCESLPSVPSTPVSPVINNTTDTVNNLL